MITREEFYGLLTSVLCQDQHEFNDEKKHIRISMPVDVKMVQGLRTYILDLFGNFKIPMRNPEDNPIAAGYKFDSDYFDIDKKSLVVNDKGQLEVVPDIIIQQLVKNEEFVKVVAEQLWLLIENHECECFTDHMKIKDLEKRIADLENQTAQVPQSPGGHHPPHRPPQSPQQPITPMPMPVVPPIINPMPMPTIPPIEP